MDTREDADGHRFVASSEKNVRLLVKATIGALGEARFITFSMAWGAATAEAEGRIA